MTYTEARELYFKKRLYFHRKSRKERTEKILEDITETSPKTLLDMGCGPGLNTFEFAKKVSLAVGSEITEEVYLANEYKKETKTKNIAFVRCDARFLPFKNCSFDVVNASQVLEHIPDNNAAISEIKRVSKKHISVDVPTLLWEVYYYTFAIWWWGLTHPIHVISKFIKKIKENSVDTATKEMWVGDHVHKWSTAKWLELLQRNGIDVKEWKKICGRSILLIHGIKLDDKSK